MFSFNEFHGALFAVATLNSTQIVEQETFEMLNVLQVHGFPKVMGILTHMDLFDKAKHIKRAKKTLKKRFEEESFAGAKLFHLSGCLRGRFVSIP